jgi:alkaline phosphatase
VAGGVAFGVVAIAASSAMVLSFAPVVTPVDNTGDDAAGASQQVASGKGKQRARNVIFIQGDGMGIAHRELIRLATKGQNGELAMNKSRRAPPARPQVW